MEIGKTRNCVETLRPQGGVFSHNFEFFQFSRVVDIQLYQHEWNRVDIQLYQHEWKLEKREIVWKHYARRAECFHTISSFSNFHELLIYSYINTSGTVLIYSYINTSGNWKNEKLCGNTTPAGRSVFRQFRVFPIFTSVDITVYQYGKNVLYFFLWREIFRVDIELYINTALSQSAFRIYKSHIIMVNIINLLYTLIADLA